MRERHPQNNLRNIPFPNGKTPKPSGGVETKPGETVRGYEDGNAYCDDSFFDIDPYEPMEMVEIRAESEEWRVARERLVEEARDEFHPGFAVDISKCKTRDIYERLKEKRGTDWSYYRDQERETYSTDREVLTVTMEQTDFLAVDVWKWYDSRILLAGVFRDLRIRPDTPRDHALTDVVLKQHIPRSMRHMANEMARGKKMGIQALFDFLDEKMPLDSYHMMEAWDDYDLWAMPPTSILMGRWYDRKRFLLRKALRVQQHVKKAGRERAFSPQRDPSELLKLLFNEHGETPSPLNKMTLRLHGTFYEDAEAPTSWRQIEARLKYIERRVRANPTLLKTLLITYQMDLEPSVDEKHLETWNNSRERRRNQGNTDSFGRWWNSPSIPPKQAHQGSPWEVETEHWVRKKSLPQISKGPGRLNPPQSKRIRQGRKPSQRRFRKCLRCGRIGHDLEYCRAAYHADNGSPIPKNAPELMIVANLLEGESLGAREQRRRQRKGGRRPRNTVIRTLTIRPSDRGSSGEESGEDDEKERSNTRRHRRVHFAEEPIKVFEMNRDTLESTGELCSSLDFIEEVAIFPNSSDKAKPVQCKGLVDSGAQVSLIAQSEVKRLENKGFLVIKLPCTLRTVSDYVVNCDKALRAHIRHHATGKFHEINMVIVPTLACKFIIGRDQMPIHGLTIKRKAKDFRKGGT